MSENVEQYINTVITELQGLHQFRRMSEHDYDLLTLYHDSIEQLLASLYNTGANEKAAVNEVKKFIKHPPTQIDALPALAKQKERDMLKNSRIIGYY